MRLFCGFVLLLASGLIGCSESVAPPAESAIETSVPTSVFCAIKAWGPTKAYAGERFNEQADGSSAFWFQTECAPERVMLVFEGQLIETNRNRDAVTAGLNADRYLLEPGTHEVALFDPKTASRIVVGQFQVLPARAPIELPEPPPLQWPQVAPGIAPPPLIAHAGGGWHGQRYLNSLEALDYNYKLGHRIFELDFAWTSDQQLVAIHDWQSSWAGLFPDADHDHIPSHAEFMASTMRDGQTQLDLGHLHDWLVAHPEAWIVTDIRGNNLLGLQRLRQALGLQAAQVIPQMYHAYRYPDIRALGYEQVIFTLYASSMDTQTLLDFIRATPLFAVTLNPTREDAQQLLDALHAWSVPAYVHTFNQVEDYDRFRARGAHGLYTDFLHVAQDGSIRLQ